MERIITKKLTKIDIWTSRKKMLAQDAIKTNKAPFREIRQGDVFIVDFGENIGFEINSDTRSNVRPAVVISSKQMNKGIAIVAPMTSKKMDKIYSHEVPIYKKNYDFLKSDSKICLNMMRSVSTTRLREKWGTIDESTVEYIRNKLKSVF
ncbi:type II toxin-antitoxin system PemK/MazF family toxin [Erysipelothrix rhusiopathiae]|nr:type II toxin-antitoxin system PemK/MazF family toxin [Erysipelothrix rhusiopathiae]